MPSKLFIIAAPAALALLAPVAFAEQGERRSWALSPSPSTKTSKLFHLK